MTKLVSLLISILFLSSCSFRKQSQVLWTPQTFPKNFHNIKPDSREPLIFKTHFPFPGLESFIKEALPKNLDIKAAFYRLKQSEALIKRQASSKKVNLSLAGQVTESFQDTNPNGSSQSREWTSSLIASYEVDLWNKLSAQEKATKWDSEGVKEDLKAIKLRISFNIAQKWIALLVEKELQIRLSKQLEIRKNLLEVFKANYFAGQSSPSVVDQQRQSIERIRRSILSSEKEEKVLLMSLNVLRGAEPSKELNIPTKALPFLPSLPPVGIPMELLLNRGDVQKAWAQLTAEMYRLEATYSNRYPTLSFDSSLLFPATKISELFDSYLLNLTLKLMAPLMDGGQRKSEIEREQSQVEEKVAQVKGAFLGAMEEVESALVNEKYLLNEFTALQKETQLGRAIYEKDSYRYLHGMENYFNLSQNLLNLESLEISEVRFLQSLWNNRIYLLRALGGEVSTKQNLTIQHSNKDGNYEIIIPS